MSDPLWLREAIRLRDQGRSFLKIRGFGDYDINQLADGTIERPKPTVTDPKYTAEVVATAIMVEIAEGVIAARVRGDTENLPTGMYLLGTQEKIAESFIQDSGHPVEAALASDGYLAIAASNNEFRRKKGRREFDLLIAHKNALKKNKASIDRRDELVCRWGRVHQLNGVSDSSLTGEVTNQYNESAVCKKLFPKPLYPLDRKWVLKILRRGGVLPPPRSRK